VGTLATAVTHPNVIAGVPTANIKHKMPSLKKPQKSLKAWTKQKWRTKSGKPSTQGPKATGERYLPESAIKSLSSGEYAATTAAKRKGRAQGKQFVAQPKNVKKKVKKFRKV